MRMTTIVRDDINENVTHEQLMSKHHTVTKCGGNNRANTVYDLFLSAVQYYHLPSRIRCDQGGENV